jgi:hypothetical protein
VSTARLRYCRMGPLEHRRSVHEDRVPGAAFSATALGERAQAADPECRI